MGRGRTRATPPRGAITPPPGSPCRWGPLEDRFRRADNVARLAFLDSLRALDVAGQEVSDLPFVFVRDDSLHPDETTRPGWEARLAAIVRAYGGARSLAGYFLADEPRPSAAPTWAPLARLLRRLDPAHPAYVNFLPIAVDDAADPAAAARWRAEVTAAVTGSDLALFTFDAYPFGPGEERPHFLATLREAARVSHATGRPFGAVLQWTGHGELRAVTGAEAEYQASQALAHGASGITWFTYWTPNPDETPWLWHGGAVAYDGTKTERFGALAAISGGVRKLAAERGSRAMRTVHLGGGLPRGFVAGTTESEFPPHIEAVRSGPCTIGWTAPDDSGRVTYVLANRDRERDGATFVIAFDSSVQKAASFQGAMVAGPAPAITIVLAPGGATVVKAWTSPAPDPHIPSRSGTR